MSKIDVLNAKDLAELIASATPNLMMQITQEINQLENADEIRKAITWEIFEMLRNEFMEEIWPEKECCGSCQSDYLTQKISEQVAQKEPTEDQFDLNQHIKTQLEINRLSHLIGDQLEEWEYEDEEEDCLDQEDIQEIVMNVLNEIVDQSIVEDLTVFHMDEKTLQQLIYLTEIEFYKQMDELNLTFDVEFNEECKGYFLMEVVTRLLEFGYHFSFKIENNKFIPIFMKG